MILIPDDPIIQSCERFGYPPWYTDGGYDDDWEGDDGDVYYGNETCDY